MKREKIEQFLIRKQETDLLDIYKSRNKDIKDMMNNLYNASFRFGLNETQTIYMLNEAVRPFKMEILSDLLES